MRRSQIGWAVVAMALVLGACSATATTEDGLAGPDLEPTVGPTASVSPSSAVEGENAVEPNTDEAVKPIPTSADPCVRPADHTIGGRIEYAFDLNGTERPVAVNIGGQQALDEPIIFLGFHGAGRSWSDIPFVLGQTGLESMVGPKERQILFAAQAGPGASAFWAQSESFNVDYLEELFRIVGRSVCVENATVIVFGIAQGALVAAEAICNTSLQIDLAVMMTGLTKLQVCDPDRPVPILSFDRYDFDPNLGPHWDGKWNPPVPALVELTGGIDATPNDLASWAEVYNCADDPDEDFIGIESLERQTTVLSYRECDAKLVAFGMLGSNGGYGIRRSSMALAEERLNTEIAAVLGDL